MRDPESGTVKPIALGSVRGRTSNVTGTGGLHQAVLGVWDLWAPALKHLDERLWLNPGQGCQSKSWSLLQPQPARSGTAGRSPRPRQRAL